MKSLFIILLAGYAMSNENNYYVIEMQDVPPSATTHQSPTKKPFNVYWNVPTMQCASKKINFENLFENYGIIQNDKDRFKGEKITILYDPGLFPALFKNESGGKIRFRNGGVPQEGNLNKHLDEFKKELDHSIPDKKFSGIGIIDFESWRPQFRQNFGVLQPYKEVSFEIERKLHWWWKETWIKEEAKRRFEEAARTFMQSTLSVAKQLRPRARWGFYGFPYCFNMASNNLVETCANGVPQENDEISWLWSESSALYPSVYSSKQLSGAQLAALVRGRLREAARCAAGRDDVILPYFWYRYRDAGFLTETDLAIALSTLHKSAATGILIWGSSNDVNTAEKCTHLKNYVQNVLGPAIAKYTKPVVIQDTELTEDYTTLRPDIYTKNPIPNLVANVDIVLDPEFHWMPAENYTQDLKNDVEENINNKFGGNVTNDNNHTVLQNNSLLIDLILNSVLNNIDNASTTTDNPKTKYIKKSQLQKYFVESTTEIDVNNNTDTSQFTSNVVTNNPIFKTTNDINNTEIESHTVVEVNSEMTTFDDMTTTEETIFKTEETDIVYTDLLPEAESINFINETTMTFKTDIDEMTENDYDVKIDYDDFNNSDPKNMFFNKETTVTVDDQSLNSASNNEVSKNEKNVQTYTQGLLESEYTNTSTDNVTEIPTTDTLGVSSIEFTTSDFTIENNNISIEEDGNEGITELYTTKYTSIPFEITTNQTETISSIKTTTDENSFFKSSTSNDEQKDEYESNDSFLSTTSTNLILVRATNLPNELTKMSFTTEDLENSITTESTKEETKTLIVLETSEIEESEETEVTTSIVPSTDQVSGASQVKRAFMFCFIFYIYSLSKCLCSIFEQCV